MERKIVSGIMLTLLLTSVLTLAFNIKSVKASGTIYIRADGSIDPPTAPISSVDNVTYTFTDNINGSMDPIGALVVERDNIVVDGASYTVRGTGAYDSKGISLSGRNNITIMNVKVEEFDCGIKLDSSSNNTLSGNNLTNNNFGIWLSNSSDNTLSGNNGTENDDCGIWLDYHSDNNTLSGNNLTNSMFGIELAFSSDNTLSGNNPANNDYGIALDYSSNNTLSCNNVANNAEGILLSYSSDNTLFGNIANSNVTNIGEGIRLSDSPDNTLSCNNVANNAHGILLSYSSDNNTLSGNNVANNAEGIDLYYSSDNNTLSGNNLTNNREGIWLSYSSSNNSIFHNDFVGNSVQVYSDNSSNTWDDGYPSGGNYWSDYNGIDLYGGAHQNETGSDGIGDTPYVIDANNRDDYPLMKPYPWDSHDIGITYIGKVWETYYPPIILPLKTIVGLGFKLQVNVFVMNYGAYSEVFNVTVYANTTAIDTITNIILATRNSVILNFTWDTTGFAMGNYTISAYAWPVPGETDTADSNFTWSVPVHMGVPGDVSGSTPGVYDRLVGMKDITYMVSLFNTRPNSPHWNPNADVNDDGVCNMKDIAIAIAYFDQHE